MTLKSERMAIAIGMLLVFATGQVYLGVSFAEPGSIVPGESLEMMPQQSTGILSTLGNKEITVNAANSMSGATIVSGSSIETPAGVSAKVSLISRGSLEIDPNTKVTMEFDQSRVKVMLTEGCVNLLTRKGTAGEISTPKGPTGKTDPAQDGKLASCPGRSAAPIVGADGGGLFSLGTAAARAIIVAGETAVAVPVAPRGVLY